MFSNIKFVFLIHLFLAAHINFWTSINHHGYRYNSKDHNNSAKYSNIWKSLNKYYRKECSINDDSPYLLVATLRYRKCVAHDLVGLSSQKEYIDAEKQSIIDRQECLHVSLPSFSKEEARQVADVDHFLVLEPIPSLDHEPDRVSIDENHVEEANNAAIDACLRYALGPRDECYANIHLGHVRQSCEEAWGPHVLVCSDVLLIHRWVTVVRPLIWGWRLN